MSLLTDSSSGEHGTAQNKGRLLSAFGVAIPQNTEFDQWQKERDAILSKGQGVLTAHMPNQRTAEDTARLQQLNDVGDKNGWIRPDGGMKWGLRDAFLNPATTAAIGAFAGPALAGAYGGGTAGAVGAGATLGAAEGTAAGGGLKGAATGAVIGGAAAGISAGAAADSGTALTADQQLAQSAAGLSVESVGDTAERLNLGTLSALNPDMPMGSSSPTTLGGTNQKAAAASTVPGAGADMVAPGGIAQDPISAPASEAAPSGVGNTPGSAGMGNAGSSPSAAPSLLTQAGDALGKIGTFGQHALEIGSLLGGIAGLSAKSPSAPEPAPPPAPPTPTVGQIPTQADAKQGLMGDPSLAGPSTTWLTGASGVPDDELKLGRQTLLGR